MIRTALVGTAMVMFSLGAAAVVVRGCPQCGLSAEEGQEARVSQRRVVEAVEVVALGRQLAALVALHGWPEARSALTCVVAVFSVPARVVLPAPSGPSIPTRTRS